MHWHDELRTHGYAHFPRLTPERVLRTAANAIQNDLNTSYDPTLQTVYDNQSYCPGITAASPITDLFIASPIYGLIDELLGVDDIGWSKAQIAIRKSHNCAERI